MTRRITLGQYLAIVFVVVGTLTVLGWIGVQRYEAQRIDAIVARELSKLEAIQEGASLQQQAALRSQARLVSVLEEQLTRVVRFGERELDSLGRIVIRRAMDTLFYGEADYRSVELFDAKGAFLAGVENAADNGRDPRLQYLPHPLSQHITNRVIPEQRGLLVYPAELATRNGVVGSERNPVLYTSQWVRSDAGRPVWLLVTKYDLEPFYEWAHRIAHDYPTVEHIRVADSGKILIGGERFAEIEFAEDAGVPGQRLGDVLPAVWSALTQPGASRYRTETGLYFGFVNRDTPSLELARGFALARSILYMPNEGLYQGSFVRSTQGVLLVVLIYLAMGLIGWGFWSQVAARRVLEEKDRALSDSLGRLRHATQFGRLGLLETPINGGSAYANTTFFAMHGLEHPAGRELTIQQIDDLFPGYGAVRREHADAVERLLADADGGRTETIDYDYHHPDGSTRRYRMVTALDASGKSPSLRTLYSDITDLHEQRKALALAADQQTSMFKIIAHELRTPAAATHMIAEELPKDVVERRDLLSASGHLLDVIDDLRITVNPDASIESKPMEFSLSTLLAEAERQVRAVFASMSMRLEIDELVSDADTYFADAYRLRAVLTNLLRNAAYHSEGRSAWVSVDIHPESSGGDRVIIRVEDDGKGIPEESVDRLFDPFERGDTNVGGTGVGLHIARSWIEMLGGSLIYRPSEFGGACFEIAVCLPRVADGAGSTSTDPVVSVGAWIDGKAVLLVEDDLLIRTATQRLLEREYSVHVAMADDGLQAINLLKTDIYDIIVTDFLMPNMDGLDMIKAIRASGNAVPIFALTAATIGDERDELLAAGADRVVSKPLTLEKFEQAVSKMLERQTSVGQ